MNHGREKFYFILRLDAGWQADGSATRWLGNWHDSRLKFTSHIHERVPECRDSDPRVDANAWTETWTSSTN